MKDITFKTESYKIIGVCMEVHRLLGRGLLEIVYKDAMEYEFKRRGIPYERERAYEVEYKDTILPHKFYADFVVYDNIILEVKAVNGIVDEFIRQTLNYVAIAKSPLGILINFGGDKLQYKRLVL